MSVQSSSKKSVTQRWDNYQPTKSTLAWACAGAAVATMIVGFTWGGWTTGGTSETMAKAAGDMARGELASAICVERFNAAPDAAAKLAEFKAIPDSYKKRQFVEAGGWATMPGQTNPDRRGAETCAVALDVAPKFYPVLSSFPAVVLPCWAGEAAGACAEPLA